MQAGKTRHATINISRNKQKLEERLSSYARHCAESSLVYVKRKQAPKAAIISLPPHKWNEKIETLSPSCFVFMYTADSWDSKMAPQWTCCIDIPSWIKVHFVAHTWSASGATWLMWLDCKEHLPRSLSTQPLHEVHHCEKGNHTESDMLWEAQVYQMEICEERKMPGQFSVISATFVVVDVSPTEPSFNRPSHW